MQHVLNHCENRPTGLVLKRSIRETASDLRYIADAWATYLMTRDDDELGFYSVCARRVALVRDCLAYHGWNETTWWVAVDATNSAGDFYKIEALGYRREHR